MDSATALQRLLTRADDFLKYYPVKCAGTDALIQNAANLSQYKIDKRHGHHNVPGHRGATRPGLFGHQREISSFKLEPGVGARNSALAHIVPMVNYNSDIYGCLNLNGAVNAMPYYLLDGGGAGLMVTGELSGCCFTWSVSGGNLRCIHVQPADGISGTQLQNSLGTNGRFAASPHVPLSTFGSNEYPTGRASIIGVRHAGQWKLYAQLSSDSFDTVAAAYQIYPGPMRRL